MLPLVALLASAGARAADAPATQRANLILPGDFGTPRELVPAPADPKYKHLAWPKVVRTADGTLVLAYLAGPKHTVGGRAAVSRSTDGGRTFSPPQIVMNLTGDRASWHSGNLALGVANDGAVVLLAMAFAGDQGDILGWRSADAGATWTPTDTSALARCGSVYGHVFAVPGRGLAVCGHYRKGFARDQGIWMAFSADDGRTWSPPATVTEEKLVEPAVCRAGDRLVGLFRDDGKRFYRQFVSDDRGDTWRESDCPVGGGTNLPSPFVAPRPDASGAGVFALQSERNFAAPRAKGEPAPPGHVFLWSADAATLRWRRVGRVASFTNTPSRPDYGYPWMTPMGDGRWFLVFYHGASMNAATSIWGMTIDPLAPVPVPLAKPGSTQPAR